MRKRTMYALCAIFGAVALLALSESDWILAMVMGACLGLSVAFMVHAYPNDIAPPSDRRHEATQRRRGIRI